MPSPVIHSNLTALASLAVTHKHRSACALKISLGEGQRLADPKAGAPEHDDQTAKAQSGWALPCLAHHGDDLLHPGRVGGYLRPLSRGARPEW